MSLSTEDAGRIHAMIAKGRKETSDFDEKGHGVVLLASDPDALASALAGMDDGHKVLMRLADDPDAPNLLQHRGIKLASALGKYAAKGTKEEAAKKDAPPPKPAAVPESTSADAADMKEFDKMRTKETAHKAKPPASKITDPSDPAMPLRDFFRVRDKQEQARQAKRRNGRG